MELTSALKIIRKDLLLRDEPLKAYELMKLFNHPDLKGELERSYGLVRHLFDKDIYERLYGAHGEDDIPDAEMIEPREMVTNARGKYARYDWILAEIEHIKPSSYLDLACYVGSLVTTVASTGIEARGVDMTQKAVQLAGERAKAFKITNAKFFRDDITKFDKYKADIVSAFEVLEHVPNPVEFIKHLKGLSKKFVYITTPNLCFGDGDGNQGHWDWDGVDIHVRGHVRAFSKKSLQKLIDDAGCEATFLEEMADGLLWCKFKGGADGIL